MTLKPCKCGAMPFCFPKIGDYFVLPITDETPLAECEQIEIWPSFGCVKCGRNSEPKALHDEAVEAWNKLNE